MHPAFLAPGSAAAIPIWFVNPADVARYSRRARSQCLRVRGSGGFRARWRAATPFCRAPTERWPASCSARSDAAQGPVPRRQARRGVAAAAPIGLPMRPMTPRLAALAFALGAYRFARYGKSATELRLELPAAADGADLSRIVEAVYLARDLVNTPANDMGPGELADAAATLATRHGAAVRTDRGRRPAGAEFSADPRGRPRRRPGAAPHRHELGRSGGPQGHAGRQGRVLRHRRARHQARQRHAADEEGHGRRRERAGARPHDHGPQAERAAARADPGGRELDFRRRIPAARHLSLAQGIAGRGRQYRCRRTPDPCRCAGARRRGGAGTSRRHGHAHRRRPRRARARPAAVLYRRRGACGRRRAPRPRRERSGVALTAVAALRPDAGIRK